MFIEICDGCKAMISFDWIFIQNKIYFLYWKFGMSLSFSVEVRVDIKSPNDRMFIGYFYLTAQHEVWANLI